MSNDLANLFGDGDGPAIIPNRPTTENVAVMREGEIVVLQIGNSLIRMKWKTALTIGHWLTVRAAEAKFLAGETKRLLIERQG